MGGSFYPSVVYLHPIDNIPYRVLREVRDRGGQGLVDRDTVNRVLKNLILRFRISIFAENFNIIRKEGR